MRCAGGRGERGWLLRELGYGIALFCRIPSMLPFSFGEEGSGERVAICLDGSKSAREKKILPVKILIFLPVKPFFWPWKKSPKLGVKTNHWREKSQKPGKTHAWKPNFAREKNEKEAKKRFHARDFFHAQKKKHWVGCLNFKYGVKSSLRFSYQK